MLRVVRDVRDRHVRGAPAAELRRVFVAVHVGSDLLQRCVCGAPGHHVLRSERAGGTVLRRCRLHRGGGLRLISLLFRRVTRAATTSAERGQRSGGGLRWGQSWTLSVSMRWFVPSSQSNRGGSSWVSPSAGCLPSPLSTSPLAESAARRSARNGRRAGSAPITRRVLASAAPAWPASAPPRTTVAPRGSTSSAARRTIPSRSAPVANGPWVATRSAPGSGRSGAGPARRM